MASVYHVDEKMHKLRVKLYPSYLPGTEGKYIARTANEAYVTIRDIAAAMINRGGYHGTVDEVVEIVTWFFKEMGYQVADGFAIDLGFFTIHLNIGGTFDENERYDLKKHPMSFRFSSRAAMLKLQEDIEVIIEGIADTHGYIATFLDVESDATNTVFVPGHQFVLNGNKIKVAGDNPDCGVYIVPVDDPSRVTKITRFAENSQSKVIGLLPNTRTGLPLHRVEIRTQFSGGTILKTPRLITSSFLLEEN